MIQECKDQDLGPISIIEFTLFILISRLGALGILFDIPRLSEQLDSVSLSEQDLSCYYAKSSSDKILFQNDQNEWDCG